MKNKIILCVVLSLFVYISLLFIPQDILLTKISLILSLLLVVYSGMLWLIEIGHIEPKVIHNPVNIDISIRTFLGRNIHRFFMSGFLVVILLKLLHDLSVWVMTNGYKDPKTIVVLSFAAALALVMLFFILKKETRYFYRKVAYKRRFWFQTTVLLLLVISISFGNSIEHWGIHFLALFVGIVIYSYIRRKIFLQLQNKANYHDCFKKPPR